MRYFEVGYKKWWYRFIPSCRRNRRVMQALVDYNQEAIKAKLDEEYRNLLLYGCSIRPDEFYGKGIPEDLK